MPSSPDRNAVESAIASLLAALGHPVGSDPQLTDTPRLAASALVDEMLDGYNVDVPELISAGSIAGEPGLVVLTDVRYASVCPHHLMPSSGIAHVGYMSSGRVLGIGAIVRVLNAFAHRLVLQEDLGVQVARSLVDHLGARGAGVVLAARHMCLAARGERQGEAAVVTQSWAGTFVSDANQRDEMLRALQLARAPGE